MKIHEYQAKELFRASNIPTLKGKIATSADEAVAAAKTISANGPWVVKAQIHAGGRGKGGGVKIAKTLDEAGKLAAQILGMNLVTHQTGPERRTVRRLLIAETLPIERELYLGIVIDRAAARPVFMAS